MGKRACPTCRISLIGPSSFCSVCATRVQKAITSHERLARLKPVVAYTLVAACAAALWASPLLQAS